MDGIGSATAWVMCGETADCDAVISALATASWPAFRVAEIPETAGETHSLPALIIMALEMPGRDGAELAGMIRGRNDAIGRLPIVAVGTCAMPVADVLAAGFDDLVLDGDRNALVRAAERWRPEALPAGFARLSALFGATEALALLDGFRSLLIAALGDGVGDDAGGRAHRVAGMAGMLGFAELGRAWLDLSEGEHVDPPKLRRLTRRAIVAIDRAL